MDNQLWRNISIQRFLKHLVSYAKLPVFAYMSTSFKTYKYLGITFNNKGNMNDARAQLYGSALKAMHKLRRCIGGTKIDIKTALRLFDSLISPIILYGCELTNMFKINDNKGINHFIEKIFKTEQEKLQLNFCRMILGVNNKTANVAVLGEIGRFPLFSKALKFIINFYNRAIDDHTESLLKNSFREVITQNINKSNWFNWIEKFCRISGKSLTNPETKINMLQLNFEGLFKEYWRGKLFNDTRNVGGNKLRTYRLFKQNFVMEPYLNIITDEKYRKGITRLRVSNHKLQIEAGRYLGQSVEDKIR